MKKLANKKVFKTISLMFVIIFITNVFMPMYSYADEDEEMGGKLFKPIFKLFAGTGDLVMRALQKMFIGYGSISDTQYETESTKSKTYKILYSPGVIFSNKVPGLNANFINPSSEKYQIEVEKNGKLNQIARAQYSYIMGSASDNNTYKNSEEQRCLNEIKASEYGYNSSTKTEITNTEQKNAIIKGLAGMSSSGKLYKWEYDKNKDGTNETYYLLINYTTMNNTPSSPMNVVEYSIYNEENATIEKGGEIEYSAYILQKTISKWYKALRLVALVGLLSVLVYVGIRIIISSTGQEKAKYKKMIMDWLAAICILFVLQYIMAFTMTIVENLINIFETNVVEPNGEDILMTSIRQAIGDGKEYSAIFSDLILYLVLVIYTVVFTIHYLKRLVYLAFFTMIAPLIALTYPLDKIKDGQAQAFTMWLREYVFNALIPVIHILLYSIFVGSAIDFAKQNPLYAIVCIGFLIPAEKFIRKMFGFDKATTSSQIGAATSGAMVMNAINKIGGKGGAQGGNNGAGGKANNTPKNVRTPNGNPLAAVPGATPPVTGGNLPQTGGNLPQTGGNARTQKQSPNKIRGVGNLINNQAFKRKAVQRNLGAIAGLGGKAMGTTIGIAAGIATGDFTNAFKYGAAGFAAGGAAGKGLVNKGFSTFDSARSGIDNIRYDYNEGAYGTEYAQNELFDREFKRTKEYKDMVSKYKNRDVKNEIQEMLDGGISDPAQMNTILNTLSTNGVYAGTSIKEAIGYSQLASKCSDSIIHDSSKFDDFLATRGIHPRNTSERDTIRQAMIDFK